MFSIWIEFAVKSSRCCLKSLKPKFKRSRTLNWLQIRSTRLRNIPSLILTKHKCLKLLLILAIYFFWTDDLREVRPNSHPVSITHSRSRVPHFVDVTRSRRRLLRSWYYTSGSQHVQVVLTDKLSRICYDQVSIHDDLFKIQRLKLS